MEQLFANLATLGLLTLLQAVLGFDNLLYISLESKRAPAEKQALVRRLGIGIAVVLRIVLLFVLIKVIGYFTEPLFHLRLPGVLEAAPNLHSIIVLLGGVFIIYTATKEILHMMNMEDIDHAETGQKSLAKEILHMMNMEDIDHAETGQKSLAMVIFWIVAMNLVFSFDSILSAMALSDVFWVMGLAIVIGGALMIWLSDRVAGFLAKNRMYEVLGLFILFVVGIMLLTEGGHLGHLLLFDREITPMSKTTFYFVIGVLVLTDIVQGRYQRKLMRSREAKTGS